jgi:hypothetical protein
VEWLVESYIALRELTEIPGPPESYKSWMAVDLARAVLTGGKWLDRFPVKQGKVIYVEQERAQNLVYQVSLLERAYDCDLNRMTVMEPGMFTLKDPSACADLLAAVECSSRS